MAVEHPWSTRSNVCTRRAICIPVSIFFCCVAARQHFWRSKQAYFIIAGSSLRRWASQKGRSDHCCQRAESRRGNPWRSRRHSETDKRHCHFDGSLLNWLPELSRATPGLPATIKSIKLILWMTFRVLCSSGYSEFSRKNNTETRFSIWEWSSFWQLPFTSLFPLPFVHRNAKRKVIVT